MERVSGFDQPAFLWHIQWGRWAGETGAASAYRLGLWMKPKGLGVFTLTSLGAISLTLPQTGNQLPLASLKINLYTVCSSGSQTASVSKGHFQGAHPMSPGPGEYKSGPSQSPLTPVRTATTSKSTNNKCWRGCGVEEALVHCWWDADGRSRCGKQCGGSSKKLKTGLSYD